MNSSSCCCYNSVLQAKPVIAFNLMVFAVVIVMPKTGCNSYVWLSLVLNSLLSGISAVLSVLLLEISLLLLLYSLFKDLIHLSLRELTIISF